MRDEESFLSPVTVFKSDRNGYSGARFIAQVVTSTGLDEQHTLAKIRYGSD